MDIRLELAEIQKLRLTPKDLLLVKVTRPEGILDEEYQRFVENLREEIKRIVPDQVNVGVYDGELLEFKVVDGEIYEQNS